MSNKIINGDRSMSYEPSKSKRVSAHLNDSCDPLQSPLMTFFNVVGFVSSISFQRYLWYWYQFFNVSIGFLFSLSIFFIFIVNYVGLFLTLKNVAYDTRGSWVIDVIYDSLNYTIFLNILYIVLFYLFFWSAKKNSK